MKSRKTKKEKTKNIKNNKSNNNNQSISEDNSHNEFSIINNEAENSSIIDIEINNNNKKEENKNNEDQNNKDEESNDIFEKALLLMDKNVKNGMSFISNYEPNFSINYVNNKFEAVPIFTPSTRLNAALQIEDKNEAFFYFYTQKKTLYPTIYNQLIGISGSDSLFVKSDIKEKDFIWANLTSIIFTNQKEFINLKILINEYINPIMRRYKKTQEEKKIFLEQLFKNIIIQEYYSYEELFIKLNELNFQFIEHKINNVGLIIIDGINSITPHSIDILKKENENGYTLKFYKYSSHNQNSNRKNKRTSNEKNYQARKSSKWDNNDIVKNNIYGNDSAIKKRFDNSADSTYNELFQQNIVDLMINYQEKYKFNIIFTVFDFIQDNYYNACFGGRIAYKESKNVYILNHPELQKENCYFTFKLVRNYCPKKIIFYEPINLCLNYNENIFGVIINPVNTMKFRLYIFKKNKDEYRPNRIAKTEEYEFK